MRAAVGAARKRPKTVPNNVSEPRLSARRAVLRGPCVGASGGCASASCRVGMLHGLPDYDYTRYWVLTEYRAK
eukprot:6867263-Prymnesium_polylepis.1